MDINNTSPECKTNSASNQSPENVSRNDPSTSKRLWSTNGRTFDRKHGMKRDASPERDVNGVKSPKRKKDENSREDKGELKVLPAEQPMQMQTTTSSNPNNGYATSDYFAVDPSQSNYMMPQYNMYNTMNQWGAPVNPGMPGMDMASNSTGMKPYPYMVPPDPSMYRMMAPMPGFCPMPMMNSTMPGSEKTVKVFPSCTLNPPPPSAPPPSRRSRPNGCKTVFVGGLPEKITEEIVKEAFSECGEIDTVRMSKKNFCHIRFTSEHAVDQALFFSGYRIKIENKDEAPYNSRLHVDFAVARDDQYEYECLQSTLSREACPATLDDPFRPPSPPPIVNYSECEAATVREQLRDEETFKQACQVLATWLERGECNKRNSGEFYSMIQSTYSQVKRFLAEKTKIEVEIKLAKNKLTQKCESNGVQFNDIENVFKCASMQKVWDHFTKAQRKNIDTWKNHTSETKTANQEELLHNRVDDEMELSDEEDKASPDDSDKSEINEELSRLAEEIAKLEEENELLRGQLRASTDEGALVNDESDKKYAALLETYKIMQQNYFETKKKLDDSLKEKLALDSVPAEIQVTSASCSGSRHLATGLVGVTENETRLATLIATFLNVHPFGASIHYICAYLFKLDRSVNTRDVEMLMKKFKIVFKEESTGIGATLEKKWTFLGFKNLNDALKDKLALDSVPADNQVTSASCSCSCYLTTGVVGITESETRLGTLIATFLNVHPFGASIDYICSYLVKMDRSVNTRDVETLLKKFKIVFKEESTGIGATLEKKWTFLGFKNLNDALKDKLALDSVNADNQVTSASCSCHLTTGVVRFTESETRLATLIAVFLNIHPFGASIDYICSYLVKMDRSVNTRDVETLLKKFKIVFKEESTGIGATLEKKWTFLGFKNLNDALKDKLALDSVNADNQVTSASCSCHLTTGVVRFTESETRLATLIATFLNVHPFGASIDYICSYLFKMDRSVNTRDVETLLKKFKIVFKEESTGIGATLEKKWTYLGFKNLA